MENLVYHARRMVNESNMADDAKMEVLDFLNLDDILALKEYRKLGTVQELKVYKEKNVPKIPLYISLTHEGRVGNCPCCNKLVAIHVDNRFCKVCGQKLNWT